MNDVQQSCWRSAQFAYAGTLILLMHTSTALSTIQQHCVACLKAFLHHARMCTSTVHVCTQAQCAQHSAQARYTARVLRVALERDSLACQPSPLVKRLRPGQNWSGWWPAWFCPGAGLHPLAPMPTLLTTCNNSYTRHSQSPSHCWAQSLLALYKVKECHTFSPYTVQEGTVGHSQFSNSNNLLHN